MYNNGNSSKNVTGSSVVDGTLENADYADNGLSGDKIDGGIISNFQSTGIDDRLPTGKVLTLSDSESIINMPSPSVGDKLLDIQNNGSSKFQFYEDGKLQLVDSTPELYMNNFYNMSTLTKASPDGSGQVTITVELHDTTAKYGTVLVEVFLCSDTGSSSAKSYYKGTYPVAVRAGASTSSVGGVVNELSSGITANSATTSVTTLTLVFDTTYTVTGYVIGHGGMGYMTSALLTGA